MFGIVDRLARTMAIVGGVVLLAIIVMTCISILGRTFGLGEIKGNYEILEAGVAFSIFSFLPVCQLYGTHATVDVFTAGLSQASLRYLRAFWEIILTAIIILLTHRLFGGVERYFNNGETTLFLQFPVWWSYAASFVASVVACIVGVYTAIQRITEALTGQSVLPVGE